MNEMQLLQTFFLLLIGHALADYPLQGDFIGKYKSHRVPSPLAGTGITIWPHLLTAHSLIHAGAVFVVTGSFVLSLIEFAAHWIIDFTKSAGRINYHQDQGLHVLCKFGYMVAIGCMVH